MLTSRTVRLIKVGYAPGSRRERKGEVRRGGLGLSRRFPASHTAQKNTTSHRDQSRIPRNLGLGSGDYVQYGRIRRSQGLARGA